MARGELRRRDRELDTLETERLLVEARVGRVGTTDREGVPYVVPMNYVYDAASRTIFLHCAASGHLLDNLAFSSLACFEVDDPGEIIATGPDGCSTSQVYRSAICFGRARVVDGQQDREMALRLFVRKYVDQGMPERRYDPTLNTLASTAVIAMQVERMTGKRRPAV
ncbi:MAG: pyridoxamine 5'-phosphate oxidase family protein [Chloroflexi bacterium]|nr:pyridoxamine 5'-phosphate oxidase family protein [Chloroflexota bacterium]